jgi:hypothetical protein
LKYRAILESLTKLPSIILLSLAIVILKYEPPSEYGKIYDWGCIIYHLAGKVGLPAQL